jgi:Lar family restriction alleviation protein
MPDLKLCPFCGHNDTEIELMVEEGNIKTKAVRCKYCGATGEQCTKDKDAIDSWNTRAKTELELKYKDQVIDTCIRAEKAETDIKVLVLRLMGEDSSSFAPRWGKRCIG